MNMVSKRTIFVVIKIIMPCRLRVIDQIFNPRQPPLPSTGEFCGTGSIFSMKLLGLMSKAIKLLSKADSRPNMYMAYDQLTYLHEKDY